MNSEILKQAADRFGTPSYFFDTDIFAGRVAKVRKAFGEKVGLCYSIKANPFLLASLPEEFSYIEVCSPGELSICERAGVPLGRIIFSGVNKTYEDVERAFEDGVAIFTAESALHLEYINKCVKDHCGKAKVILRLAHGSQFGIDREELVKLISERDKLYEGVEIIGIHYFTGTAKKKAKTIAKELDTLDELCNELSEKYAFTASHIEYGTGLAVEYYKDMTEQTDMALLEEVSEVIKQFSQKYPLTVEMGRFFAAECGYYLTKAMDIKTNGGTNYVICDGGINQLNYYGQNMAMNVPPVEVLGKSGDDTDYCLCGSLCTTADVLVRKVSLPRLDRGDVICFKRCGAYSVAEGIAAFLSRAMPNVLTFSEAEGFTLHRPLTETYPLNTPKTGGNDL